MLPSATVSLAPGQAGAAQLPKETHPQGTDPAFLGPELEMRVLGILQHCKTLYKPFRHLLTLQDHLQTLPGVQSRFCRECCFPVGFSPQEGGWSGRKGDMCHVFLLETCRLSCSPLPAPVSHLILAHWSVPLRSCADGGEDAALRITAHGGSTPLQKAPAWWGEPGRLRGLLPGFTGLLDGIKDGFSLWLGRLTAQWSVEDEEEAARERRRREREKQLRSQAEEGLNGTVSCSESAALAQENQ